MSILNLRVNEILREVAEDSTTSIGSDVRELSEGETPEVPIVHPLESEEEVEEVKDKIPEDEVEESKEEIEEEVEEVPELLDTHPFERPTIKQLTETYPDISKKFPSLKDMYFREAEYTKLFPTIDDAKEANENNDAFVATRDSVINGDGTKFISAIKEVSEKNLERFAANILPSLFKIHPAAFWRSANPLVEEVARAMFQKGVKEENESLQNAAKYLSDYFFGSTDIAEGKKTTIIKDEIDPKLEEDRTKFENERHTAFRGTIESDTKTQLLKLIDSKDPKSGKSRLDPDGEFSIFIKTTIIDRIIADLGNQLQADTNHIRYMDSLWKKAVSSGRTDTDKARIVSAYLARAKSLIPTLRSKYVSEARGSSERHATVKKEK